MIANGVDSDSTRLGLGWVYANVNHKPQITSVLNILLVKCL